MAKHKGQDHLEEIESYTQDDLSYEAFKRLKERAPALVEAFRRKMATMDIAVLPGFLDEQNAANMPHS